LWGGGNRVDKVVSGKKNLIWLLEGERGKGSSSRGVELALVLRGGEAACEGEHSSKRGSPKKRHGESDQKGGKAGSKKTMPAGRKERIEFLTQKSETQKRRKHQ